MDEERGKKREASNERGEVNGEVNGRRKEGAGAAGEKENGAHYVGSGAVSRRSEKVSFTEAQTKR